MKLIPNYSTKTIEVHHADGTVETFKTRTAAIAMYPELAAAQPVEVAKQTKGQQRAERRQAGQRI